MTLQIASINSGSNGNCYYVGNLSDAVLVDVGLPAAMIERRMKQMGLDIKKVKALFISHEHTDHIKGLSTLAHRHFIPIYITHKTARGIKLIKHLSKDFTKDIPIEIGTLTITPFLKQHDAIDAHSFIIEANNVCVGVLTDIGEVCNDVKKYFSKCNAVFLETNYDDDMLQNGKYSEFLKKRITGSKGHLSNKQALELCKNYSSPNLSLLILSHISKENNSTELVKNLFESNFNKIQIQIASRYEPTPIFEITEFGSSVFINNKPEQKTLF